MIRAGVVGATGYAGAELVRILQEHPEVDLTIITSRQYAGEPFSKIYPALSGFADLPCEEYSEEVICDRADVIFTALPHKVPMEIIPGLVKKGRRVIDLSADFRFQDVSSYEAHYQPHTARDILKKAVYGLSEVYKDDIQKADVIGNPGCYPTSVMLPLIPLLQSKIVETKGIIADSKSGVSGAGRSPGLGNIYCEVTESFKAYKTACHRHNPEMNEILSREAETPVSITFSPHLLPMSRGMLSTVYADLARTVSDDEIRECLKTYYQGRPFVRICPAGRTPSTLHVRGTNFCDIGVVTDLTNNRLILVSVIDNLVKGAAGQAVQNMNIMFDLDEASGLNTVPYPL